MVWAETVYAVWVIFQDRLRKTGRVPRVEQSIVAQRRVVPWAPSTKGTGGLEPPWALRLAGEPT